MTAAMTTLLNVGTMWLLLTLQSLQSELAFPSMYRCLVRLQYLSRIPHLACRQLSLNALTLERNWVASIGVPLSASSSILLSSGYILRESNDITNDLQREVKASCSDQGKSSGPEPRIRYSPGAQLYLYRACWIEHDTSFGRLIPLRMKNRVSKVRTL